jgi:hypothetical protein
MNFIAEACLSLRPDSGVSVEGDVDHINWDDVTVENGNIPTIAEINTEVIRLEADWTAKEYARNRASEYPSLLELTVALYDTDDKSAVEAKRAAVKAKYPKPE